MISTIDFCGVILARFHSKKLLSCKGQLSTFRLCIYVAVFNQNLFVLLIKDKGEYIGIIPLKTSRVKYRGFKIKKIGFIESEIQLSKAFKDADIVIAFPQRDIRIIKDANIIK